MYTDSNSIDGTWDNNHPPPETIRLAVIKIDTRIHHYFSNFHVWLFSSKPKLCLRFFMKILS